MAASSRAHQSRTTVPNRLAVSFANAGVRHHNMKTFFDRTSAHIASQEADPALFRRPAALSYPPGRLGPDGFVVGAVRSLLPWIQRARPPSHTVSFRFTPPMVKLNHQNRPNDRFSVVKNAETIKRRLRPPAGAARGSRCHCRRLPVSVRTRLDVCVCCRVHTVGLSVGRWSVCLFLLSVCHFDCPSIRPSVRLWCPFVRPFDCICPLRHRQAAPAA